MRLGGFADTVLSVLLGWVTGIVQWVFSLFNGRSGSLLAWFGKYWLVIAAILVGAGLIIDWLVWLISWQPYQICASRARRFGRWIARKPPEEDEQDDLTDGQATARYVPMRGGGYAEADADLDEEYLDEAYLDEEAEYLDEDEAYLDEEAEYLDEEKEYPNQEQDQAEDDAWQPDPAYAAQMAYQRSPQREKLPPQPEISDAQFRDYPGKRYDPDLLPHPPLSAREDEQAYEEELDEAPYTEEEVYEEEVYEEDEEAYGEEQDIDFAPGYAQGYSEEEDLEDMGDTKQRRRAAEQQGARDTEFATFEGDAAHMAQQRAIYGRPQSETASNAMADYDAENAGRRRRRAIPREQDETADAPRETRRQPRRERTQPQPAPEPPRKRGLFAPRQEDPDVDDWYSDEPPVAPRKPAREQRDESPARAEQKQKSDKPERKMPGVVERVMRYAEQRLDPAQPKKRGKLMQLFDPQEERVTGLPPRVDKDQAYSAPTMPKPREEVYEDWYEDE